MTEFSWRLPKKREELTGIALYEEETSRCKLQHDNNLASIFKTIYHVYSTYLLRNIVKKKC